MLNSRQQQRFPLIQRQLRSNNFNSNSLSFKNGLQVTMGAHQFPFDITPKKSKQQQNKPFKVSSTSQRLNSIRDLTNKIRSVIDKPAEFFLDYKSDRKNKFQMTEKLQSYYESPVQRVHQFLEDKNYMAQTLTLRVQEEDDHHGIDRCKRLLENWKKTFNERGSQHFKCT